MLTFFRKTRQTLLAPQGSSTNVRRYILYAIGEIILVMFGILLALQVNNWNENRQNRRLEKVLLKEIHEEFKYNGTEFEENIDRYDGVRNRLGLIYDALPLEEDKVSIDSLAGLFRRTNFTGNFDVSLMSISKLKNTSSFSILSNQELSNLLLRFEVLAEDYEQMELEAIKFHEEIYSPTMNKKIPRPYHEGILSPRADKEFLRSVEFENLIHNKRTKINNLFRTVEQTEGNNNIIQVMERIIELTST